MRKFMFEPSNAKAGGFQVDKDIAPLIIGRRVQAATASDVGAAEHDGDDDLDLKAKYVDLMIEKER